MAGYSQAAANSETALNNSTDGGFVEEYEVSETSKRVRRGTPTEQVRAALMLEGIAARRSGGLHHVVKFRKPRA